MKTFKTYFTEATTNHDIILYHATTKVKEIEEHGFRDMYSLYGALTQITSHWYGPALYTVFTPKLPGATYHSDIEQYPTDIRFGNYVIKLSYTYNTFLDFSGKMGGEKGKVNEIKRLIQTSNISSNEKVKALEIVYETTRSYAKEFNINLKTVEDVKEFLETQLVYHSKHGFEFITKIVDVLGPDGLDLIDIFFTKDTEGDIAACYRYKNATPLEYTTDKDFKEHGENSNWVSMNKPINKEVQVNDDPIPFIDMDDRQFADMLFNALDADDDTIFKKYGGDGIVQRIERVKISTARKNMFNRIVTQYPQYFEINKINNYKNFFHDY